MTSGAKIRGDSEIIEVLIGGKKIMFRKSEQDGLYYMSAKRIKDDLSQYCYEVAESWNEIEKKNKPVDKSKWKRMNRDEAHRKWGHQHKLQLDIMGNHLKIKLVGKLNQCAGCALIKARAKATVKTSNIVATTNGERIFIDATGPYPASRGGMKFWFCAVDDKSDKTWTYFSRNKNKMIEFVKELVQNLKGKEWRVKFIRCDNAGEHMNKLKDLCLIEGITLEYTSPNTPQQNARCEKKIHIIWQRAMAMMVNAKLTIEAQKNFWAEAVSCSNYLEDFTIKQGRDKPALEEWTGLPVDKYFPSLIEFGRIGVEAKKKKLKSKMKENAGGELQSIF